MPDQDDNGALKFGDFACPICDFDGYCRVIVSKPAGGRYVTDFYRCGGCSVMFKNPLTFSTGPGPGGRPNRPSRVKPRPG